MTFPFGRTLYRLRAQDVIDEYSSKPVRVDWNAPLLAEIPGAFIAQTSTTMLGDATRSQALEAKSLFCDADADIQKGDRIFDGTFTPPLPANVNELPEDTVMTGATYSIDGIPPVADTNPFTGWTPIREIPLTRGIG